MLNGDRIPRAVLLDGAPSTEGTVHYNHEGCPGGVDTRGRLYITRKADGTILGYCHNCGSRGAVIPKNLVTNIHEYTHASPLVTYRDINGGTITSKERDLIRESAPEGYTTHTYQLNFLCTARNDSPVGRAAESVYVGWFERYGIDLDLAAKDGWLFFNEYSSRPPSTPILDADLQFGLLFPSRDIQGCITGGLQYKYWNSKPMKCRTFGSMSPNLFNPNDSPLLVIVEDRLSAIKVTQATGVATLCMHGAKKIDLMLAHQLAMMFDKFYVWYDFDNASVIDVQNHSVHTLRMFSNEVNYFVAHIGNGRDDGKYDPKNFESDYIQGALKWLTSPS